MSARPGVWLTDLSLVLMAVIWGVNFSVVKFGTTLIDPLAYNGVRIALAAAILVAIAAASPAPLPSRRTIATLFALGILGNGVYQVFFIEGVSRARAGDTALVVAASPAFIAIIGRMRGVETIQRRAVFGIVMSIIGIACVVVGTASIDTHGESPLLGDALVLCGSLSWAIYTVLLQPHTLKVSGLQVAAFTMCGGAISLCLAASPHILGAHWSALPFKGWSAIVYSGVFALVIAYLFWYNGVRTIGPTRTAMYSNLQPIVALLFAWATLGETPTPWQIVGAASIMGGLLLTRT